MLVSDAEYKYLEDIEKNFRKNLNKTFQCKAIKEAAKEGSPMKQAVLRRRQLVLKINKIDTPDYKAHILAQFNQAAIPLLKRKYGQDALLDALPAEAKTQKAIDICEQVGAKKLATLCRLSMM